MLANLQTFKVAHTDLFVTYSVQCTNWTTLATTNTTLCVSGSANEGNCTSSVLFTERPCRLISLFLSYRWLWFFYLAALLLLLWRLTR